MLECLATGARAQPEIREETGASTSYITQALTALRDEGLVEKSREGYGLQSKGRYLLQIARSVEGHGEVLDVLGDRLNRYVLGDVPDFLVARLCELRGLDVVQHDESAVLDVYAPHESFLDAVKESEWVKGYTPVMFTDYVDTFRELAGSGIEVDLVVSPELFGVIQKQYGEEFREGVAMENVDFRVADRMYRYSFLVTESFVSLSFYLQSGFMDHRRDYVCREESGERWGRDLFRFVQKRSVSPSRE